MNNRYIVRIESPLLRPGLTIETESSERYLVDVVNKALDLAREINKTNPQPVFVPTGHTVVG